MRYRADIDGLRAVAVLPVVAFHAGISTFSGGFVGVDVFFVISGYLISSIILSEFEQGRFSLLSFYERRIRRIFPALVAVLIVTTAVASVFLLPVEFERYAESLLATVFSLSNFYFWQHSGYFDVSTAQQPLLHTWSLAVEEQFYVLFPLLLVLARHFSPRNLKAAIIGVAGLSLFVSALGTIHHQATAFYLLHSRAWELLLGTILAMGVLPPIRNFVLNNLASALGLCLILYSVFNFSEATPFPGIAALLPCAGAALIIHSGQGKGTVTNWLLALPPLVFIGLISYSLYLWHWPIIVFQQNHSFLFSGFSSSVGKGLLVLTSLAVGALSWRFIERPFRQGGLKAVGRPVFIAAGTATAALSFVAILVVILNGFPGRFSPGETQVASYLDYDPSADYRKGTCFVADRRGLESFNSDICLRQISGRKNYLVFGDSFAADLWHGLSTSFPEKSFLQATGAGCTPTLAHTRTMPAIQGHCASLLNKMFLEFLAKNRVDALLIAGSWRTENMPDLAETLDWLNAREIKTILFGPKIQYDAPLPRILVAAIRQRDPSIPDRHMPSMFRDLDAKMAALARSKNVTYLSFFELQCEKDKCQHSDPAGRPMAFDTGHFTKWGSLATARNLQFFKWP